MTNGSEPVAPGGEHNNHAGAPLEPADADDAAPEAPAEPPLAAAEPVVPAEPVAPAEEMPDLPEPPPAEVLAPAEAVAAELVAADADAIDGKLTPPYWPVSAVPATPEARAAVGAAAVCAAAGLDRTSSSGNATRAVIFRITES